MDVDAGGGERKVVVVERYLVQLGFALPTPTFKRQSEGRVVFHQMWYGGCVNPGWHGLLPRRWNTLMHILHSNHGDDEISLRVCNVDGLQKEGRWEFIVDNTTHFMALSETHATAFNQKTVERQNKHEEHAVLWGRSSSRSAVQVQWVEFVYKRSATCDVSAVKFLSSSRERFHRDGRLMLVRIFVFAAAVQTGVYYMDGRVDAGRRTKRSTTRTYFVQCMRTLLKGATFPPSYVETSTWRSRMRWRSLRCSEIRAGLIRLLGVVMALMLARRR